MLPGILPQLGPEGLQELSKKAVSKIPELGLHAFGVAGVWQKLKLLLPCGCLNMGVIRLGVGMELPTLRLLLWVLQHLPTSGLLDLR